jgi:hypothetical protein
MRAKTIGIEVEMAVLHLSTPKVCSFLPWTKKEPLDIGGTLYHKDASMFEVALRPASSPADLDLAWQEAYQQALSMLPDGWHFELNPSEVYSNDELMLDEYASVLGCSTSDNVYGASVAMPEAYPDGRRYAGLHINIEGDGGRVLPHHALCLDATLGLLSVAAWEGRWKEGIVARRKVYGRAGEFRVKPFGLEYRTLPSCAWQRLNGNRLFELVDKALSLDVKTLLPLADSIREAINNCNEEQADDLISQIHGGNVWATQ